MEKNKMNFRCPFEVSGKEKQGIIEIDLFDDRTERLESIYKAFEDFHRDIKKMAIKFILPKKATDGCFSNSALKPLLLPYQAEFAAAELGYRLSPFLPYQGKVSSREEMMAAFEKEPFKIAAVSSFLEVVTYLECNPMGDMSEMARVIELAWQSLPKDKRENPTMHIGGPGSQGETVPLIEISAGGTTLLFERSNEDILDPVKNKNAFVIVTTPFYPKEFGRFSEKVTVTYTREAHFLSVNEDLRRKIRFDSNIVLENHGVHIKDLREDKQPSGLWVVNS